MQQIISNSCVIIILLPWKKWLSDCLKLANAACGKNPANIAVLELLKKNIRPADIISKKSIENAIDVQKLRYFQGRRDKNPEQWRKEAATVTINHPDDTLVELWDTKAEILDKLGRSDDAAPIRKLAAKPGRTDAPSPYKSTHERLKDWLKQHRMETPK